ncbi:MAG: biphenyl 2,3-dioxygenase [Methylophaga sp.]|nr:biphenyl 2,3-dioxygenase [Methylophaga sp.]
MLTGFLSLGTTVSAEGDLTRQEPITVEVQLGVGNEHRFSPSHLEFETGKLYKLVLINNSQVKHYFTSFGLAKRVFSRKVQVMQETQGEFSRTAEIKGDISEIEVFPGQRVEWWFVPVQTGELDDLHCHVDDEAANMTHAELGMTGTISIK